MPFGSLSLTRHDDQLVLQHCELKVQTLALNPHLYCHVVVDVACVMVPLRLEGSQKLVGKHLVRPDAVHRRRVRQHADAGGGAFGGRQRTALKVAACVEWFWNQYSDV